MIIRINEMIFYGYHGVHPEERKLGQRFIVNLEIETNHSKDSAIKELHDTVDYTQVYEVIKLIMETHKFLLLEECANTILTTVLDRFRLVTTATVSIRKPSVPINGHLSSVEICMSRTNSDNTEV